MSMSIDDLEDPFDQLGDGEGEGGGRVQVDTLIERKDLGSESFTLVAAGSFVPPHLAHLPTRPAQPEAAGDTEAGTEGEDTPPTPTPPPPGRQRSKIKPKASQPTEAPPEEPAAPDTREW